MLIEAASLAWKPCRPSIEFPSVLRNIKLGIRGKIEIDKKMDVKISSRK